MISAFDSHQNVSKVLSDMDFYVWYACLRVCMQSHFSHADSMGLYGL